MPSFEYKAYQANGAKTQGFVDAADRREAARKLTSQKLKPYALTGVGQEAGQKRRAKNGAQAKARLTVGEAAAFFGAMSTLLESGFQIEEALATNIKISTNPKIKKCFQTLREQTNAGDALFVAMENTIALPSFCIAIVKSGERSGALAEAISRLATVFEDRQKSQAEMISAITYPLFLLCLLIIILTLLSLSLVPSLAPLFSDSGTPLPFLLSALLAVGDFLSANGLLLVLALGLALAMVICAPARVKVSAFLSVQLRRAPWLGAYAKDVAVARYLRTLSILVSSRISLPEALDLAAQSVSLPKDQAAVLTAQREVIEGERLSVALTQTGLFADYTTSLIGIGERSNNLAEMIGKSAALMEDRVNSTREKCLGALSPTLTIFIGLIVGSLVISVMSALLSLNEAVLQ